MYSATEGAQGILGTGEGQVGIIKVKVKRTSGIQPFLLWSSLVTNRYYLNIRLDIFPSLHAYTFTSVHMRTTVTVNMPASILGFGPYVPPILGRVLT